jgi:hypothetical protein
MQRARAGPLRPAVLVPRRRTWRPAGAEPREEGFMTHCNPIGMPLIVGLLATLGGGPEHPRPANLGPYRPQRGNVT